MVNFQKLFLLPWALCSFLILFYECNIYSHLTEDIIYNLFDVFSAFALFLSVYVFDNSLSSFFSFMLEAGLAEKD